jgi:menaquinone-dependent protoporphyrinogen IX oxidase
MNKVLVIYFSNYGTTKRYAEWIATDLNGDIYSINNFRQIDMAKYHTIILGSGLYAGKIQGIDLFIKNYEIIKDKKLIIFTCGIADYSKPGNISAIYKRIEIALPKGILEKIKIFYLRGGIDYKKLSIIHKIMMWLMKKMVMKKEIENIDEEHIEFMETYGKIIDFTNRDNISDIKTYCK